MRVLALGAILVALQGCQSLESRLKYQLGSSDCRRNFEATDAVVQLPELQPANEEIIIRSRVLDEGQNLAVVVHVDMANAWASGYEVIGSCSFTGGAEQLRYSQYQAAAVRADVVVRMHRYLDTQIGTSEGNVYSYKTYEHWEVFYRKVPEVDRAKLRARFAAATGHIGILVSDISPEETAILKKNTGAVIRAVWRNSPAFDADIVPGDVIVSLDGAEVDSAEAFQKLAMAVSGRRVHSVAVGFLRDGKLKSANVTIRPYAADPFPG